MKVAVIESSGADDFYHGTLDGLSTHQLLSILRINSRFTYGLDLNNLNKSLARAKAYKNNVLHLSCHGESKGRGLVLGTGVFLPWADFVKLLQDKEYAPTALVVSACFGGIARLAAEFNKVKFRPSMIFGSRDARPHGDYATAWAILYRVLKDSNIDKDIAKVAVRHINAVVKGNFVYRGWDSRKQRYHVYPSRPLKYQVAS